MNTEDMTGQEIYGATEEGKKVFIAGDLIYEAYQKIKEASALLECVKDVQSMTDLYSKTKAEVMVLSDLSDAWTEQSHERILEIVPEA